jgi:hypothetical protein
MRLIRRPPLGGTLDLSAVAVPVCRICGNKDRCDGQMSDGHYTWETPIFNTSEDRGLEKRASLEGAIFHYPAAVRSCVGFEPAAH